MNGAEDGIDQIHLVLPAARDYVALARFAAGVMAVRANFDIEEVEDLQLAVDELYASSGVLDQSVEATEFDLRRDGSAVTISLAAIAEMDGAGSPHANGVVDRELSQQLLSVLVDDHGASTDEGGQPRVWLRKSHPQ